MGMTSLLPLLHFPIPGGEACSVDYLANKNKRRYAVDQQNDDSVWIHSPAKKLQHYASAAAEAQEAAAGQALAEAQGAAAAGAAAAGAALSVATGAAFLAE
jgi:hypothetical protein